jgi:hypothetical protein
VFYDFRVIAKHGAAMLKHLVNIKFELGNQNRTDGKTDNGNTSCPILFLIGGIKRQIYNSINSLVIIYLST